MFSTIVQIYVEHDMQLQYCLESGVKHQVCFVVYIYIHIIILCCRIVGNSGVVAHITCDGFLNHFTLETELENQNFLEIPKSNHRHCHTSQASHGLWHAPHFIQLQFHIPTLKIMRHLDFLYHTFAVDQTF